MSVDLRKQSQKGAKALWPLPGSVVRARGVRAVVKTAQGVYGADSVWVRPTSGGPGWPAPVSELSHDPAEDVA